MSDNDFRDQAPTRSTPPRAINIPMIVLVFALLCSGVHLVREYLLSNEANFEFLVNAAFIPARYQYQQELSTWAAWTTPFTYSVLHGGFGHLINNMLWLIVFGSPLAASTGALRFTLFWLVCSAGGALIHYLALPLDVTPMIGASGAIAGMMGAAARFGFQIQRSKGEVSRFREPMPSLGLLARTPSVLTFLAIYIITNLVIGADDQSNIAWQAHLGGIAAGFLFVPLFLKRSYER